MKEKVEKGDVVPQYRQVTFDMFWKYYELSSYLFNHENDLIYNVTEIPEDSKFYKEAREMAKQLEIGWDDMTHDESNRIMLGMLEDSFNIIRDCESSSSVLVKDYAKLSEMYSIPAEYFEKMYMANMLNVPQCVCSMVEYDYKKISATLKYKDKQIVIAMASLYGLSKNEIRRITRNCKERRCIKCGRKITHSMFARNRGYCESCYAITINN